MCHKQFRVKVMNKGLNKSATILAETFVDFKRKAATALSMSGWLNVRVYKARDFEVSDYFLVRSEVKLCFYCQDVTSETVSKDGTVVSVESFPFIDFDNSVLVVNIASRAHSFKGRNVQVVHQGHDQIDSVDIHES